MKRSRLNNSDINFLAVIVSAHFIQEKIKLRFEVELEQRFSLGIPQKEIFQVGIVCVSFVHVCPRILTFVHEYQVSFLAFKMADTITASTTTFTKADINVSHWNSLCIVYARILNVCTDFISAKIVILSW